MDHIKQFLAFGCIKVFEMIQNGKCDDEVLAQTGMAGEEVDDARLNIGDEDEDEDAGMIDVCEDKRMMGRGRSRE